MRRITFPLLALLIAPTAWAQDSSMIDRLSRLERDVTFLQKQVYQDGKGAAPGSVPIDGSNAAQLQVRLTAIEEDMRNLRGQVEQATYENQRVSAENKKFMEDVQMRLQALEQKQAEMATAAPLTGAPVETPAAAAEPAVNQVPATYKPSAAAVPAETPKVSPTGGDFPNSNEHYNYAYKLMQEKNYADAATSFDDFVRTYPKDPLLSNAYYWLGESYYVRSDYTRAAEGFRKGFEANPNGQKAPDNLFKLALSLSNIKRNSEACIVLAQVVSKYGDSAPSTAEKATSERARLQCK